MYLGRIVEQTDTASLFMAPRHPCSKAMPQCSRIPPRPIPAPGGHVECHLYDEGTSTHAQP